MEATAARQRRKESAIKEYSLLVEKMKESELTLDNFFQIVK
jgi:hypothetical protein